MERIHTRYGPLAGVATAEFYPGGGIRECTLNQSNPLETRYGILVPQYRDDGVRRKYTQSLSFYPNGILKSISLQEQRPVATPLGAIPAELLTFYESGALRRIFPLNGKLSGYWTEANEYGLAEELELELPCAKLRRKIIGIHFYEGGTVRSITLWPKEHLTLDTPQGRAEARIGFSLYPAGQLQAFEPFLPLAVATPIGPVHAYHLNALGIHADATSLTWEADGAVQSLISSTDRITVITADGRRAVYQPGLRPSLLHEGLREIMPLRIRFTAGKVGFNQAASEYDLAQATFSVADLPLAPEVGAGLCPGCDADRD